LKLTAQFGFEGSERVLETIVFFFLVDLSGGERSAAGGVRSPMSPCEGALTVSQPTHEIRCAKSKTLLVSLLSKFDWKKESGVTMHVLYWRRGKPTCVWLH